MEEKLTVVYITISFVIFVLFSIHFLISLKVSKTFEFYSTKVVDNRAYWVYNSTLYYANIKDGVIEKKSIKKLENFGIDPEEAIEMIKEVKVK